MGTRFVPVPDWETAAALLREGSLWFRKWNTEVIVLPPDHRSPNNPSHWCTRMDWYLMCVEE